MAADVFEQRLPGAKDSGKRAEFVAASIGRDIMAMGWPIGESLGSTTALLNRYGVSHAILREAVRQIEQNGLAVMRRGSGRGLVITQRPVDAAAQTLATYLQLIDVDALELSLARAATLEAMIQLATRRITAQQVAPLRKLAAGLGEVAEVELIIRYDRFLHALGEAAGNPVLFAIANALFRAVAPSLAAPHRSRAPFIQVWSEVTEAVIAGDGPRGVAALRDYWRDTEPMLVQRVAERRRQASAGTATLIAMEILEAVDEQQGRKHGHLLALSIARDVAGKRLPVGFNLGREPNLLAEYRVSRNVFREAARILALHGVCVAKRGPRGGFIVGQPSPDYALRTAAGCLQYLRLKPCDLRDVRLFLQPLLAELAARRNGPRSTEDLARAVAENTGGSRAFLSALGPAGGNRVLWLLNDLAMQLEAEICPHPDQPALAARLSREAVAAIAAGDAMLARRIMVDICRCEHRG